MGLHRGQPRQQAGPPQVSDCAKPPIVAERTLADFGDALGPRSSSGSDGAAAAAAAEPRALDGEGEPIRALRKPKTTREVEREAHEAAGRTPHRDWCAHCVAGAGRGGPTPADSDARERESVTGDRGTLRLPE